MLLPGPNFSFAFITFYKNGPALTVQQNPRFHLMGQIVLGIVELFALCTSSYGLYFITNGLNANFFSVFHNCLWFIFGILSNASGIVSIGCELWEDSRLGQPGLRSLYTLQYHYFFSWMAVLIGYAGLVTQTWLTYYPARLSHMHAALVCIPIVAWVKRKSMAIVVTTQVVTVIAIMSHIYINMLAGNWWSVLGAVLMALQILSMSLPVRYTFLTEQFSTREAAIVFSGIASLVFAKGIAVATRNPRVVRKVFV